MRAEERRKQLALFLSSETKPVSGGVLSEKFKVSRQIIVQDISALKSSGYQIASTHYGYVMQKTPYVERVFKLYHTKEQTEDELTTIVNYGGIVVDVFVWHKVYGRIEVPLNIYSKFHVDKFIEGVRSGKSTELMNVTGGYHYHTVRAETEEILDRIENKLIEKNLIVKEI